MPKWLRGSAFASPSGSYIRVGIEGTAGFRGEVYLTRKQARELQERLDWILRPQALPDSPAAPPEEEK